jgi:N-methylhydantoinase B/oxoprolinase/acetone carboxylase alpha subunit
VNIKERLDFSCALFGPDGGLVANAPHLPVHLGAMSEAVRFQVRGASALALAARSGAAFMLRLVERLEVF